jgi:hypothetical protein
MVGAVFALEASQTTRVCCGERRADRISPYALANGGVMRGCGCKRGIEERLAAADPAGWRLQGLSASGVAELAHVGRQDERRRAAAAGPCQVNPAFH